MNNPITFSLCAEPEHAMSRRVRVRWFADGLIAGTLVLKHNEWRMLKALLATGVEWAPTANDEPIVIVHTDEGKWVPRPHVPYPIRKGPKSTTVLELWNGQWWRWHLIDGRPISFTLETKGEISDG